jgi:hypothetical protein
VQRTVEIMPIDRARWLADLSRALGQAQQLLFEMDLSAFARAELGELFHQIQAAQLEARTLQLSRSVRARREESSDLDLIPREAE